MVLTHNQILKILSDYASAHYQINSFGNGDLWEVVEHNQQADFKYPLMWVLDQPHTTEPGNLEMVYRICFMDLVQKDESNENEVSSSMYSNCIDIISWWNQQTDYRQITIDQNTNIMPFTERFNDEVTGWCIDLKLQIPFKYNKCDIPMDGITPAPTNCADALYKNSDSSFTQSIASGGTYTAPDVEVFLDLVSQGTFPANTDINISSGSGCNNISYLRYNLTTRGATLFTNDTEYLRVNSPSLWTPITGDGELPVLDQDTPTLLLTKNTFDNFNRVTNDMGGSVTDGSDGSTADYMIDHLTGMGWYMLEAVGDNTSWDDTATTILAGSFAGFSGWRMPTTQDIRMIETLDNINAHIFVSFSSWNDTRYWTSDSGGSVNVMRWTPSLLFNNSGKISLGAKTAQNPIAGIACRQHYTTVQPKP